MIVANRNISKITYLLRSGRRKRLAEPGQGPTEFFYGYQQLLAWGVNVSIMEDSDVGMAPPLSALFRLANKLSPCIGNLPVGMALSLLTKGRGRQLDNAGCIVATTNGMGLALAIAKALGRVKSPVLILAMGLLPLNPKRLQIRLYRALLQRVHIACISRAEQTFLQKLLPGNQINYIPFGVDHDFWRPADFPEDNYALAIGNDSNRDWSTLTAAWKEEFPPLKIITSLPVPLGPTNVEIIRGDWRSQILNDEELRTLVQGARFVVIPLRDTIQPAGQSACLQAMACGKCVILSDTAGLWDRDLIRDGTSALLVQPGDRTALSDAIQKLLHDPLLAERIGMTARRLVVDSLNMNLMAQSLRCLVEVISD